MGDQARAALTVNSNCAWHLLPLSIVYRQLLTASGVNVCCLLLGACFEDGSKNPSCKSLKPVPCPVGTITYENITSAPGTSVSQWIDFEGLPSNTIEGEHDARTRNSGSHPTYILEGDSGSIRYNSSSIELHEYPLSLSPSFSCSLATVRLVKW